MIYPRRLTTVIGALALLSFWCAAANAESMMDTRMHSMMLLNKAASKHRQQTEQALPNGHNDRLRQNRHSGIATYHRENGEGVSIGNIYAQPGTNRPHSSTVIINGPILVTGNK